jgi:2-phosphoglycerate kinase
MKHRKRILEEITEFTSSQNSEYLLNIFKKQKNLSDFIRENSTNANLNFMHLFCGSKLESIKRLLKLKLTVF